MARPEKLDENKRDITIRVRVTAAEKSRIWQQAKDAGRTPSDYLRGLALNAKPARQVPNTDREILLRYFSEMNMQGSNLNQIARQLNRRQDSDELNGVSLEAFYMVLRKHEQMVDQIRTLLTGMILRANIRGNGGQLGWYLAALQDNDYVEILEVNGREDADAEYLKQTVLDMQLMAELTKSPNAYFNVQINPAYGEDERMTREDWYKAADILAAETGYENQRRVIVLHTKKAVHTPMWFWERYNHATGTMIDNKHSRLKVDHARPKIEQALNHKSTPRRNSDKNAIKEEITAIWDKTGNGSDFIREARKSGYIIAAGTGNRPFMIVDENGRSFDLVRQINGVRTKDVRARLRHEPLITDKQAIEMIREAQAENSGKRERQSIDHRPGATLLAQEFAQTRKGLTTLHPEDLRRTDPIVRFKEFKADSEEIGTDQRAADDLKRKQAIAAKFADNAPPIMQPNDEQELLRQKAAAQQEEIKRRKRNRQPRR